MNLFKKLKDYAIVPGGGVESFRIGKRKPGFHLNKFVRDILRECGIPCPNCNDKNCHEIVTALVTGIVIQYNDNGEIKKALSIDLPKESAIDLNAFPVNGAYWGNDGLLHIKQ